MIKRTPYKACPLCNGPHFALHIVGDCTNHRMFDVDFPPNINWMQCKDCGHSFTDGYFNHELMSKRDHTVKVNELERLVAGRMIDRVLLQYKAQQRNSEMTWLDVGFGSGGLLFTAQEYGFHPYGLDLRTDCVAKIRDYGVQAWPKTIEELYLDNANINSGFDIISMCDVLEHMPFPHTAIDAARGLLNHGGLLLVSCPNMDSPVWRAMDPNPYWGEIEHYHNFSRKSLEGLLLTHGLYAKKYHVSERYRAGMEIIAAI